MGRIAVLNMFAALWLLGFGVAAVTAGAPAGVACGTLGLLGFPDCHGGPYRRRAAPWRPVGRQIGPIAMAISRRRFARCSIDGSAEP
jgi:hypothetical protein